MVVAGLAMVVTPSCVIRIGPGDGEDTVSEPSQGNQSGQDNTDSSNLTPEELAAVEAFSNADPQEVAKASAIAGYTSYLLWGTLGLKESIRTPSLQRSLML
jgi:hypothetical protein